MLILLLSKQAGKAWEPANKAALFLILGSTAQKSNFTFPSHTSKADTLTTDAHFHALICFAVSDPLCFSIE
jgi:hypothetical protein